MRAWKGGWKEVVLLAIAEARSWEASQLTSANHFTSKDSDAHFWSPQAPALSYTYPTHTRHTYLKIKLKQKHFFFCLSSPYLLHINFLDLPRKLWLVTSLSPCRLATRIDSAEIEGFGPVCSVNKAKAIYQCLRYTLANSLSHQFPRSLWTPGPLLLALTIVTILWPTFPTPTPSQKCLCSSLPLYQRSNWGNLHCGPSMKRFHLHFEERC